nr:MAG TPA: tail component protein [Caudoviricetes sp.]
MGKPIEINLFSDKSIQAAVKAIRDYENSLTYKCRLLAETLAEKGVEIARVQIADLDAIFNQELLRSIHTEYVGSVKGGGVWAVVTGTDHALFVEFGTGQMGAENPYPYDLPEGVTWKYNSGKTIRQALQDIEVHGSTYVKAGEYYWSYIGDDGKLHITKGMPSRPFMYLTAIELREIVSQTAKVVFGSG